MGTELRVVVPQLQGAIMHRLGWILAVLTTLSLAAALPAGAQWRPASTNMPVMPTSAELQGEWVRSVGGWFSGVERIAGVGVQGLRAAGNARAGSNHTQVTRLMNGPVPVVVLTDRNGDNRADMIEIFNSGSLVAQVIDADYNGQANVMRLYDASGALVREERL
jgi:hypothetical protein